MSSPASDRPVMVVTGTRKGIGRHLASHYLEQGWVVVGCSRQASDLEHPAYRHFELDVFDEPGVKKLFSDVRKRWGRLDALVNNAGVASMNHALLTPVATVERIMNTNLGGTFLFCREAVKLMQKRRAGRIVNLSTVAVPLRVAGEAVYAASKAAVNTFTAILAHEVGELGITVNAVGPPPLDTDLIGKVPADVIEALVSRQAIRRKAVYADVVNVIDFFLRPESNFVTGQVLYLGGVSA